jgi:hypothetical protein
VADSGAGGGGSGDYVDTIYRKAGQDSIFYTINGGTERAVKDSVGGGGGGGTPGGGTYSIQYNRAGAFAGRSTFVFDTVNARVGIGKSVPTVPLDIEYSLASGNNGLSVKNTLSTGQTSISVLNNSGVGGALSTYGSAFGSGLANNVFFSATNTFIIGANSASGTGGSSANNIQFRPGGVNSTEERMRFNKDGMSVGNAITADPLAGWWFFARSSESVALRAVLQNTNSSRFSQFSIQNNDATLATGLYAANSGFGGSATIQPLWATLLSTYTNGLALTAEGGSGVIKFITGGNNFTTNERMRIEADGDVGIGTASPAASSILDITSTTKGFLRPRMPTANRNAIASPAAGLSVYNSSLATNDVYTTAWYQQPNGLSGSGTLDFPSTGAHSSSDLTITVTGAAVGDIVILGTPVQDIDGTFTAFVSTANTVTVRYNHYGSGNTNPASGTFKVYVIKN